MAVYSGYTNKPTKPKELEVHFISGTMTEFNGRSAKGNKNVTSVINKNNVHEATSEARIDAVITLAGIFGSFDVSTEHDVFGLTATKPKKFTLIPNDLLDKIRDYLEVAQEALEEQEGEDVDCDLLAQILKAIQTMKAMP